MKPITCPKCQKAEAFVCADEVDIGVGTQVHIYGYECAACGSISVCSYCGGLDEEHATWCADVKKVF